MNTTANAPSPTRRAPGFREASMNDLFIDCCRLGPAPTRSRELFVIATTVILLAIIFAVVQASWIFITMASVIVAVYLAGRWVFGERNRWNLR